MMSYGMELLISSLIVCIMEFSTSNMQIVLHIPCGFIQSVFTLINLKFFAGEDNFLHSVISDITEGMCQFKLAPCYSLYLAARYRVDRVQPGMPLDEHFHKLLMFCNKVSIDWQVR